MSSLERMSEILRRRGVGPTARLLARRLSPASGWSREIVWYHLDLLDPGRPRPPLDPEFTLRRGTRADMPLLRRFPHDTSVTVMSDRLLADRLDAGATLWIVTAGDRPAFSCWTLVGEAPMGVGFPGVPLPRWTALLEDSLSAPGFRGRGVAPGTWSAIGDELVRAGMTALLTRVEVENTASRRAVEKAGFRPVAQVRQWGSVWQPHAAVTFTGGEGEHAWLRAAELRPR